MTNTPTEGYSPKLICEDRLKPQVRPSYRYLDGEMSKDR